MVSKSFFVIGLLVLAGIFACSDCLWAQSPTALVENGLARATIILADEPAPTSQEAAQALQDVVQKMTGVQLPVMRESKFSGDSTAVLVGMSSLALRKGIEVTQDFEDGDHYVIRTEVDYVALVGNDQAGLRGSAYAVYDLLQRLGCGWFGSDPHWQVIPKANTLTVPVLNIDERPAFDMRHIWIVKDRAMKDAWRLGALTIPCGHNLRRLVPPKKHGKEHPDWFADWSRKTQPCLTHPQVIQLIIQQFRRTLDQSDGVVSFSLSANDNDLFCQCTRCHAAGNVSARLLKFSNSIARELAKTHPGRYRLCFLAYWVTHDPPQPMVKAEPGVIVMQVNEGDHTKPWDGPERPEVSREDRSNTRELRAFAGWRETEATMAIYEWWIPGFSDPNWRRVPWYSGETALRNLRYWKKNGVRYLTYESKYEDGNGFPIRWPLCHIGARGMWEPDLTSEQIMTEACQKLYGPAAKHMLGFYQVIEQAMLDTTASAGIWNLPSPQTVYPIRAETRASKHLKAATEATNDPLVLARVADERRMWNRARQTMAYLRRQYTVTLADKKLYWGESTIDTQTIRDILGLKPTEALFAIQGDRKYPVGGSQTFDLTKDLRFSTE